MQVDLPGPPLFTACIRDLSERRDAEERLRSAEFRYRTLVEQLPLAIYIDRLDDASSNVYASPQIEPMLGYSVDDWASNPSLFLEVLHPDDRERVLAAHARTHATGEALQVEYRLLGRDGRVVWVRDEARVIDYGHADEPVLQGYLQEITTAKEAEEQLRHQAFHDPLTGLANRGLFTDRVEHALVVHGQAGEDVAVVFLDLDDFKAVNDSLGHLAGDALLRAVGERVRDALSPSHTVARFGGDEFAILVENEAGGSSAVDVAAHLISRLPEPFDLEGREVFVTASVGIAVGSDAEELLRSADVAMYRAKAAGKSQYVVYAPPRTKTWSAGSSSSATCGAPASTRSSRSTTRRPSSSLPVHSSASRRFCAGSTRAAGSYRRWSSSRSPRRLAGSSRSGAGSSPRRARRLQAGGPSFPVRRRCR